MKEIYKIFIIVVICIMFTGCNNNKLEKPIDNLNGVNNDQNDIVVEDDNSQKKHSGDFVLSEEKVQLEEDSHKEKMFEKLILYGSEIYEDKKYEGYPKRNEAYFISLKDLKNDFNYDISMFKNNDDECDIDNSGIFFDIDNKLGIKYEEGMEPVIPIIIGCE